MGDYIFGDYVVYKDSEIGRVKEQRGDKVFVCYHEGCTAACTPIELIRKATEEEIKEASKSLGYHTFDEFCPDRVEEYCFMCPAKKVSSQ